MTGAEKDGSAVLPQTNYSRCQPVELTKCSIITIALITCGTCLSVYNHCLFESEVQAEFVDNYGMAQCIRCVHSLWCIADPLCTLCSQVWHVYAIRLYNTTPVSQLCNHEVSRNIDHVRICGLYVQYACTVCMYSHMSLHQCPKVLFVCIVLHGIACPSVHSTRCT